MRIGFTLAVLLQMWALYVPRGPSVDSGLPLDKLAHVSLFAAVTWFGLRLGLRWIVPVMVAQAAVSELVQAWFLPQRSGDWWDFAADLAGIALGWALARWVAPTRPASSGSRRRSAAGSGEPRAGRTPPSR